MVGSTDPVSSPVLPGQWTGDTLAAQACGAVLCLLFQSRDILS